MFGDAVRTTVARWLEDGELSGPIARALARMHAPLAARGLTRPLRVPVGPRGAALLTVTIGGATLGGSGKTRLALASTRELARAGASVVLLGHAYRARARRDPPRVVSPEDALADVGDEALACARALASDEASTSPRARVVVGPSRQSALDFVAHGGARADVVVIDGALQLTPVRSSLALLAVDAEAPWGAGVVAPAGDLRAPREALLAHADHVVAVDAMPLGATLEGGHPATDLSSLAASFDGARIGLFTALARPGRVVRALRQAGLAPSFIVSAPDHGPLTRQARQRIEAAPVDLWIATPKCSLHLRSATLGAPLAILDENVELPTSVSEALRDLVKGYVRTSA